MVGHPRFRLPLERPSKRGCREGRESRECLGGDAEREFGRGACVTACNLASASSLAEITGSLFSLVPRNRPLSPSLSFSLSLPSSLSARRTKLRFRIKDIIKPAAMSWSIHEPRRGSSWRTGFLNARRLLDSRFVSRGPDFATRYR